MDAGAPLEPTGFAVLRGLARTEKALLLLLLLQVNFSFVVEVVVLVDLEELPLVVQHVDRVLKLLVHFHRLVVLGQVVHLHFFEHHLQLDGLGLVRLRQVSVRQLSESADEVPAEGDDGDSPRLLREVVVGFEFEVDDVGRVPNADHSFEVLRSYDPLLGGLGGFEDLREVTSR